VRFSFSGILEYLHGESFPNLHTTGFLKGFYAELVSTDGRRIPVEDFAPPGRVLVGEELDLEIAAAGLLPSDFLGATLPPPTTARKEASLSFDIPPCTQKRPCQQTPT
jgi:hypothetical protein